jgi:hypothetical protein
MRSPYAGRNWEGAGEDPFLVGVVASLTVQGIQENGVVSSFLKCLFMKVKKATNVIGSSLDCYRQALCWK